MTNKRNGKLGTKIRDILKAVDEIQGYSKPMVESCYGEFLLHNSDPETREYSDESDHVREALTHVNFLSPKDVEICSRFNVGRLADQHGFECMKSLHNCLITEDEQHGSFTKL